MLTTLKTSSAGRFSKPRLIRSAGWGTQIRIGETRAITDAELTALLVDSDDDFRCVYQMLLKQRAQFFRNGVSGGEAAPSSSEDATEYDPPTWRLATVKPFI